MAERRAKNNALRAWLLGLLLLALAGFGAWWLGTASQPNVHAAAAAQPLPAFRVAAWPTGELAYATDSKQPLVLHFWASWCVPCVAEFPELVALAKQMPELQIIAISVDREPAAIARFMQRLQLLPLPPNLQIGHDPQQSVVQDVFQTFQFPESILVNRHGLMVEKIAGVAPWTSGDLQARLRALAD